VAENDDIDGEVIADLTRRIQAKFDEHPIWLDVRAGALLRCGRKGLA
jgi:hypothetical protein